MDEYNNNEFLPFTTVQNGTTFNTTTIEGNLLEFEDMEHFEYIIVSEAIQNAPIKQRFLIIKNEAMVDGLFENTAGTSLRTQKETEERQLGTI